MAEQPYLLLSVPSKSSGPLDDHLSHLLSSNKSTLADVSNFPIPTFKIGTLDALILNADALGKSDAQCEGYVAKIEDILRIILQGDKDKIEEQQTVNDSPAPVYITKFSWNNAKYRKDKSISDLMEQLTAEGSASENDVRTKFNQYNTIKAQLQQYQRRATGNLSTKHLGEVVRKEHVLSDSEYMETLFFAVPSNSIKDWEKSYETLTQMVVPRSSVKISEDKEFALFNVVVFKKFSKEFTTKARDLKFIPRDFTYDREELQKSHREYEEALKSERRTWGEVLRLARSGFSDAFQAWLHLKALRVFVESVLRYGLPPEFECAILKPGKNSMKTIRKVLKEEYAHLASAQLEANDSNGTKSKSRGGQEGLEESVSALEGSLGIDGDYTPYVVFGLNWHG